MILSTNTHNESVLLAANPGFYQRANRLFHLRLLPQIFFPNRKICLHAASHSRAGIHEHFSAKSATGNHNGSTCVILCIVISNPHFWLLPLQANTLAFILMNHYIGSSGFLVQSPSLSFQHPVEYCHTATAANLVMIINKFSIIRK